MRRVLINGVGGVLGARVARRLCEYDDIAVIGLTRYEPVASLGRTEWLLAHLNGLQLVELLEAEQIDTVVQIDFAGTEAPVTSREAAVQQNVIGTMDLLGACLRAGVQQVVVRSHSWVYGASPLNPMMIDERRPVAHSGLRGFLRDLAEVEIFMAEFAEQHHEIRVASLRMAPLVGGWSPLMDYFSQPWPRMLIGFDPVIQLLSINDAVEALAHFALNPCAGPYNLAADDAVCISQAIRLSGQLPSPTIESMIVRSKRDVSRDQTHPWPVDVNFLRHPCVVDTHRAKQEMGWAPQDGVADSISATHQKGHAPLDREASEAALRAFLSRKR
ncbi:NAD-dependent epimerase/dehydratase family protein [Candidatus Oscillochloris fontis]|uniref:NAD-dependent epimerase/dehydratase family protein n=1 Tax=Candidatus Oscillochloris fontis TaxID=2496868 RepID=UPI00101BD313|nr:NAD-dependent epimerase/dehydratase family protein [Candidatus Oscillochloris fontis]